MVGPHKFSAEYMEKLTSPEVMKGDLQVDVRKVEILSAKMEDKIEELWGFFPHVSLKT